MGKLRSKYINDYNHEKNWKETNMLGYRRTKS